MFDGVLRSNPETNQVGIKEQIVQKKNFESVMVKIQSNVEPRMTSFEQRTAHYVLNRIMLEKLVPLKGRAVPQSTHRGKRNHPTKLK